MVTDVVLRPNKKRGQDATTMVRVTMVCYILVTVVDFIFPKASQSSAGISGALIFTLIHFLYSIVYLFSVILFIMWFRRAYYNLNLITNDTIYSDGWVAGFWFIPIQNLYKPYQLMREMYVKTNILITDDIKGFATQKTLSNLNLWWTLWIVNGVFSFIRTLLLSFSVLSMGIGVLISIFLFVALTRATTRLITDYMDMEEVLNEMVETSRETELEKLSEVQ